MYTYFNSIDFLEAKLCLSWIKKTVEDEEGTKPNPDCFYPALKEQQIHYK